MKQVININFQGQIIAIEETAYELLKSYINGLKTYFANEPGGDEIVNDIENRIAELFGNRLKLGVACITDDDVKSVIDSIGHPEDFDTDTSADDYQSVSDNAVPPPPSHKNDEPRVIYRSKNDRVIAGVCGGLAAHFNVDAIWFRLGAILFFTVMFWIYLILWIVLKERVTVNHCTKKLYRHPSDKYIGGVCGGIGTCFEISSWIPRLVFAAPLLLSIIGFVPLPFWMEPLFRNMDKSFLLNGSVCVVYVVLWILIPQAKTIQQKKEMMGEEEYINSIRQTVNESVANAKRRESDGQADSAYGFSDNMPLTGNTTSPTSDGYPHNSSSNRSGCLNALLIVAKVVLFSCLGLFAFTMFIAILGVLFAGSMMLPLKSWFITTSFENVLLIVGCTLSFLLPVFTLIYWIARKRNGKQSYKGLRYILLGLWLLGLVSLGVLSYKVVNKFNMEGSYSEEILSATYPAEELTINLNYYDKDVVKYNCFFGTDAPDEFPVKTVNNDSLMFDDVRVRIFRSEDSLLHVSSVAMASDGDAVKAADKAKHIRYGAQLKNNTLYLDELFAVPAHDGFRKQKVYVEIAVPEGKKVKIADALNYYSVTIGNQPQGRRNRYHDFRYMDAEEWYHISNNGISIEESARPENQSDVIITADSISVETDSIVIQS